MVDDDEVYIFSNTKMQCKANPKDDIKRDLIVYEIEKGIPKLFRVKRKTTKFTDCVPSLDNEENIVKIQNVEIDYDEERSKELLFDDKIILQEMGMSLDQNQLNNIKIIMADTKIRGYNELLKVIDDEKEKEVFLSEIEKLNKYKEELPKKLRQKEKKEIFG